MNNKTWDTVPTVEDRVRLVDRYWPRQYRVVSRFILRNWEDRPLEQCPTCGRSDDVTVRGAAQPPA